MKLKESSSKKMIIRDKLSTVLWITFFWLLISFYQYFDRYAILLEFDAIDGSYDHPAYIRGIFISLTLGGVFGASALVFVWEKWLRKISFIKAMSYIILWYVTLYTVLTFLAILINRPPNLALSDPAFYGTILKGVYDPKLFPNFLFWLVIMFLTIFFLLIRDQFGAARFRSFLLGKYFRPRREDRIFMFLDLKSSTTIAEKLGESEYFNFLNDSFQTVAPAIRECKGEIYQYVGDEIVISWRFDLGIENGNCLKCFFGMNDLLTNRLSHFDKNYGHQPVFKAGLHGGSVMAGEIGSIKREIVYSGDVLNTTARIQAQCNEFGVTLLISKWMIDEMPPSEDDFQVKPIGSLDLKGKAEKVEVVTVQPS